MKIPGRSSAGQGCSEASATEMQASMLDALPAHIALLDPDGVILTVNESWKRFAAANVLQSPSFGVGSNYLQV